MSQESEIVTVGGVEYQIGRMNAMRQFHVLRRVMGAASSIGEALQIMETRGVGLTQLADEDPADLIAALAPVLRSLAGMPDADVEYVIGNCLSCVHRKTGKSWSPMTTPDCQIMFQDVQMPHLLQLTARVLARDLRGFFADLLSGWLDLEETSGSSLPGFRTRKTG